MEFYSSIADYYDNVFPLNPEQVKFITGFIDQPYQGKRILDIGCGTGNLSLALSQHGFKVNGIDLDTEMVREAQNKTQKIKSLDRPVFNIMDMREIKRNFSANYFDIISCFGNTLVHLTTESDLQNFINDTRTIIKSSGKLLLQIINYDYILDEEIGFLPTIENKMVKFKRTYTYDKENYLILFRTVLTIKENGQQIKNEIPLRPLRKKELEEYLNQAGYHHIEYYSSFKKEGLNIKSLPLVVKADK